MDTIGNERIDRIYTHVFRKYSFAQNWVYTPAAESPGPPVTPARMGERSRHRRFDARATEHRSTGAGPERKSPVVRWRASFYYRHRGEPALAEG